MIRAGLVGLCLALAGSAHGKIEHGKNAYTFKIGEKVCATLNNVECYPPVGILVSSHLNTLHYVLESVDCAFVRNATS